MLANLRCEKESLKFGVIGKMWILRQGRFAESLQWIVTETRRILKRWESSQYLFPWMILTGFYR